MTNISLKTIREKNRKEIIEIAEPYEGAKWHNQLYVEQVKSIVSSSEDAIIEGVREKVESMIRDIPYMSPTEDVHDDIVYNRALSDLLEFLKDK
jgi:hypothetical protein